MHDTNRVVWVTAKYNLPTYVVVCEVRYMRNVLPNCPRPEGIKYLNSLKSLCGGIYVNILIYYGNTRKLQTPS